MPQLTPDEAADELRDLLNAGMDRRVAPLERQVRLLEKRIIRVPGSDGIDLAQPETLARQLSGDNDFGAWLKSSKTPYSGFAMELKLPPSRKAISGISPTQAVPGIWGPAPLPTRLRAFLPVMPAISGTVEFVQETSYVPAAAVVPETTLKPSTGMTFTLVTMKIATIASTIKMSLPAFNDIPLLQSWVDGRLRNDVQLKEEAVFINGDAANAIQGLLAVAPAFAYTPGTGDTGADVIARALGQLMTAGYSPDAIVMNGGDYTSLQLLKSTIGGYVLLPVAVPPDDKGVWEGQPSLWGLPVVISPSMPAGTFLVGAFQAGAVLFDREVLNVQISFEDQDDFVKNLCTLRGELRSALAVPVPSAFLKGTLPAGSLAHQSEHQPSHAQASKK